LPSLIVRAGGNAERRYLEFFAAQIRNRNTREAYLLRAVRDFLDWAETEARIEDLLDIEPLHVAAWVEIKTQTYEAQSVKQQLAALRHLFDWLVTGHVLHTNPASFVRGPKFSYTKGKTPILTPTEARKLIRSIPTDTLVGLRDRALIGLMIYTVARVSAAVTMNVKRGQARMAQMALTLLVLVDEPHVQRSLLVAPGLEVLVLVRDVLEGALRNGAGRVACLRGHRGCALVSPSRRSFSMVQCANQESIILERFSQSETTEAGISAQFQVWLDQAPTTDVTVPVASRDASEASVDPTSLTFTPGNWRKR